MCISAIQVTSRCESDDVSTSSAPKMMAVAIVIALSHLSSSKKLIQMKIQIVDQTCDEVLADSSLSLYFGLFQMPFLVLYNG